MNISAETEALKAALTAALVPDLADMVTLDLVGLRPSTRAAVVIQPPKFTFPNWEEHETTFTLVAVAGPADKPLLALEAINKVIERLQAEQFNIATAAPVIFDLAGSGSLPAYEITLNPS